ncbi:hypothetical protein Q673_11150 [Marinobacter sp. EN3]|nr:hypothetical protein Q673_11150 [Marinobacter sp. EN3]
MQGIIRCGSVILEDSEGNQLKDHQELIDNGEFHSRTELIENIARELGVDVSRVDIDE